MPVRAFSRVSRSSRKPSQLSWMARSSSSSASQPGRDHAAVAHQRRGLVLEGAASSSAQPAGGTRLAVICVSRESGPPNRRRKLRRFLERLAQAHQFARAHLAQRDARGDALDVAAALEFGAQRLPQAVRAGQRWQSRRCCAWLRSRRGSSIQHLSMRLPMPVMQVSSSEKRVGESSPRRVCTSSRLRRVVTGRSISSSSRCTGQAAARARARGPACARHRPAARPPRRGRGAGPRRSRRPAWRY